MSRFFWLGALLAGLLLAPSASGTMIPFYDFDGTLPALKIGGDEGPEGFRIGVLTGQTAVSGSSTGLFAFFDVDTAVVSEVRRVELYDPSGNISRLPKDEFGIPTQVYVDVFENATVVIRSGSTFVHYARNATHTYDYQAPFSLAMAVKPPSKLPNQDVELALNTTLLTIGDAQTRAEWIATSESSDFVVNMTNAPRLNEAFKEWFYRLQEPVLAPINDDFTVTITGENRSEPVVFQGRNNILRFLGHLRFDVHASNAIMPLGANVTATFKPGDAAAAAGGFDLGRIEAQIQDIKGEGSNEPSQPFIDPQVQEVVASIAPLLNGALITNHPVETHIFGRTIQPGVITLFRYSEVRVKATDGGDGVAYEGQGRFLLAGNQLFSDKTVVKTPVLPLPPLSLVLWVLAIIAIILGFALKPFLPTGPGFAAGVPIRILGIGIHILLLILAFVLWDVEIKAFLGTSLLSGAKGLGLMPVAGIQLGTFAIAGVFFGLPTRFILNSGLKLVGMKKARGLGKGIGNLAQWGLGAAFLPVFLNPILQVVFNNLATGF